MSPAEAETVPMALPVDQVYEARPVYDAVAWAPPAGYSYGVATEALAVPVAEVVDDAATASRRPALVVTWVAPGTSGGKRSGGGEEGGGSGGGGGAGGRRGGEKGDDC